MFSKHRNLGEVSRVRQIPGEEPRRWFSSRDLELIVWFATENEVSGFQLCYLEGGAEKAFTWRRDRGYSHARVDEGEPGPGQPKRTPMLARDDSLDTARLGDRFAAQCSAVPPGIARMIKERIRDFPVQSLG